MATEKVLIFCVLLSILKEMVYNIRYMIFVTVNDCLSYEDFLTLFLFRQEKGEKKPTQGALYVLLPQSNPPPCVSPGRIAIGAGAP